MGTVHTGRSLQDEYLIYWMRKLTMFHVRKKFKKSLFKKTKNRLFSVTVTLDKTWVHYGTNSCPHLTWSLNEPSSEQTNTVAHCFVFILVLFLSQQTQFWLLRPICLQNPYVLWNFKKSLLIHVQIL